MDQEKITTLHPAGKSGRTIARTNYDIMKAAIIHQLAKEPLTHSQLFAALEAKLSATFPGNVSWYAETIKLDLEARGVIMRVSNRPATYRLA